MDWDLIRPPTFRPNAIRTARHEEPPFPLFFIERMKAIPHLLHSTIACLALTAIASSQSITNGKWTVERIDGRTVKITAPDRATADFAMDFRVFLSTKDPKPAKTQVTDVQYVGATSWVASVPDPNSGIANAENKDFGDGFDPEIVTKSGSRTANLFSSAASKEISPVSDRVAGKEIIYEYATDPSFGFTARIGFDPASGMPVVTTNLKATGPAYYSLAYVGAPSVPFEKVEQLWQPLVWEGRRFPTTSYLTAAYQCPLPSTLVTTAGKTIGVVAHPDEFPFMPLPDLGAGQKS